MTQRGAGEYDVVEQDHVHFLTPTRDLVATLLHYRRTFCGLEVTYPDRHIAPVDHRLRSLTCKHLEQLGGSIRAGRDRHDRSIVWRNGDDEPCESVSEHVRCSAVAEILGPVDEFAKFCALIALRCPVVAHDVDFDRHSLPNVTLATASTLRSRGCDL